MLVTMPACYLTIDDSPTPHTSSMCAYLRKKNIPALLFIRGDMVEKHGRDSLINAVKDGFIIGNHAYSHTRFSQLPYDQAIKEIEAVETIINDIYAQAGTKRPGKYFRFPHLDRGAGGYVVDYDAYPDNHRGQVISLFADGVNIEVIPPTYAMIEHKNSLQSYLKSNGFIQPFQSVTFPWFQNSEMGQAGDCLYTFSTSDWMILDRHRGKWKYKNLQELKEKIDSDPSLNQDESRSIILIHDKEEPEFSEIFKTLVDHMVIKGYEFKSIL